MAHAATEASARQSDHPIVIADDDAVARELVERCLRRMHLLNPIEQVQDGSELCARLEGGLQPVLLLLDQHMPGRTGIDVVSWLADRGQLKSVPVIMLTGSAELDDVNTAHRLGIRSYLVKPIGFSALSDVVRSLDLPWQLLPPSD